MHLICLGVMRKLLLLWCCGKPSTKLAFQKISDISSLLKQCSPNVPLEFNRKPRGLNEIRRWKATEFRQFLLYTGPIVLQSNINRDRYINFLSLHIAVIILSHPQHTTKIEYASELLKYFVKTFKILYGPENMSHNVHNLLHITDDVKYHGVLDNFSAFPFENHLQSILKSLRKCEKPLQQIVKRHSEKQNENYNYEKKNCPIYKRDQNATSLLTKLKITSHSKSVAYSNFILTTREPDNCCRLKNGDVIIIKDIVLNQNEFKFLGNKYLSLTSLYSSPCESSDLGIFAAKSTDFDTDCLFEFENVDYKCLHFKIAHKSFVVPIIHTQV
ncbi:uncharacterized protein LOC116159879 isoform X1 [Photinus pyralis]|uniref:uncharacterized protein LOC116159879 isoform X1 n=1 Tax=Photinus pyralis TaxID=7054 RepID=UPI001266F0F9|nr:uncharacterized protein LOC116159879 isoform X1 [Photinus pyralis]XP_031328824.1 uncharacterized protein LOC116159879 isoform X1 [Photinus pyralis]XP_031328825.1 uncharacterized protein LOC116159879 isoform X1 [Photinus pyralis]